MLLAPRCAINGISQQGFSIEFVVFIHGRRCGQGQDRRCGCCGLEFKSCWEQRRGARQTSYLALCSAIKMVWQARDKNAKRHLAGFRKQFCFSRRARWLSTFFAWRTPLRCGVCCAESAVRSEQGNKQKRKRNLERAKGIEPSALAWEARVLPLYDARIPRL